MPPSYEPAPTSRAAPVRFADPEILDDTPCRRPPRGVSPTSSGSARGIRIREGAGGLAVPRIVAGWAGSLQLAVPPDGTRPTSDRTREALFSMLESRDAIAGAAVLDLYAGSGAFGLEALSRGRRLRRARREGAAGGAGDPGQRRPAAARRTRPARRAGRAAVRRRVPRRRAPGRRARVPRPAVRPAGRGRRGRPGRARAAARRRTRSCWSSGRPAPPRPRCPPPCVLERTRTYGDTAVHLLTPA